MKCRTLRKTHKIKRAAQVTAVSLQQRHAIHGIASMIEWLWEDEDMKRATYTALAVILCLGLMVTPKFQSFALDDTTEEGQGNAIASENQDSNKIDEGNTEKEDTKTDINNKKVADIQKQEVERRAAQTEAIKENAENKVKAQDDNDKIEEVTGAEGEPVELSFKGIKRMADEAPGSMRFDFQLLDKDGKVLQTVQNDSAGNINFAPVSFDKAGNYTYNMREVIGNNREILYDDSKYRIEVTVTEKEGKLSADYKVIWEEVNFGGDEQEVGKVAEFDNDWDKVVLSLDAVKLVDGEDVEWSTRRTIDTPYTDNTEEDYYFQLKDSYGNVIETTENLGSFIQFADIEIDKEGTYLYSVEEIPGKNKNMIYDDMVAYYVIDVYYDEDEEALDAEVNWYTNDGDGDSLDNDVPTFNNVTKKANKSPATGDGTSQGLALALLVLCAVYISLSGTFSRSK